MSPNGMQPEPDPKNPEAHRKWLYGEMVWLRAKLEGLRCVEHGEAINKLEASTARTAGQRSMLRMALPYVIPVITAIGGVFVALKYGPAPAPRDAPATPRVTTSAHP